MIKSKIYVMKIIIYMTFIRVYHDIFVYTLKTVIYAIKASTCFDVNKHLLEVNNFLQIIRNIHLR